MTKDEAKAAAQKIVAYWAERGVRVKTRLVCYKLTRAEKQNCGLPSSTIWGVTSDLKNGRPGPRRAVLPLPRGAKLVQA